MIAVAAAAGTRSGSSDVAASGLRERRLSHGGGDAAPGVAPLPLLLRLGLGLPPAAARHGRPLAPPPAQALGRGRGGGIGPSAAASDDDDSGSSFSKFDSLIWIFRLLDQIVFFSFLFHIWYKCRMDGYEVIRLLGLGEDVMCMRFVVFETMNSSCGELL